MENKTKRKSKTLKIIIIILVCLIGIGGGYLVYSKYRANQSDTADTGDTLDGRNSGEIVSSDEANNALLTETVWYNDYDNSALVFPDTTHFVWYADTDYTNSQNYMAGIYTFYNGKAAYDMIASLYSEDEEKPEETNDNSMLVLTILSSVSNGVTTTQEEPIIKYFFGYFTQYEMMSYIDMATLDQYDFYANIENTTATKNAGKSTVSDDEKVKLTDSYKDIVYAEDTSAWETFEIKYEGNTLSFPWSGYVFENNGWECGTIDEDSGLATFKNGEGYFDVRFANKETDDLKMINANANGGSAPSIILPNGITWYSTLEEILSAYGEPTSNTTDDNGANILTYESDNRTMILTVMGEETYSNAGLVNIYLNGK